MKSACCVWCGTFLKVRDTFNDLQHKAVCSVTCKEAEMLFTLHWSDKEINRRAHYQELTKGEDDDSN